MTTSLERINNRKFLSKLQTDIGELLTPYIAQKNDEDTRNKISENLDKYLSSLQIQDYEVVCTRVQTWKDLYPSIGKRLAAKFALLLTKIKITKPFYNSDSFATKILPYERSEEFESYWSLRTPYNNVVSELKVKPIASVDKINLTVKIEKL